MPLLIRPVGVDAKAAAAAGVAAAGVAVAAAAAAVADFYRRLFYFFGAPCEIMSRLHK